MSRFARSWALVKASGTVLQQDKVLLVFPLLSAVASLIVVASFIVPLIVTGVVSDNPNVQDSDPQFALWAFLFYLVQYFVIFFFNAALVGAAMIRLDGGEPTVGDGLRVATSKIVPILGYAAIAATVGMILRMIEERAGFIGRWIAGLLGLAFTVATFLVVPLLVSRDIGPVDAVRESAEMLKKTWGENIIGNAGLGFAFFIAYFLLAVAAIFLCYFSLQVGSGAGIVFVIAITIVAFVLLALIHAALQGVYAAALYRFATTGEGGGEFDGALMENAFRQKA